MVFGALDAGARGFPDSRAVSRDLVQSDSVVVAGGGGPCWTQSHAAADRPNTYRDAAFGKTDFDGCGRAHETRKRGRLGAVLQGSGTNATKSQELNLSPLTAKTHGLEDPDEARRTRTECSRGDRSQGKGSSRGTRGRREVLDLVLGVYSVLPPKCVSLGRRKRTTRSLAASGSPRLAGTSKEERDMRRVSTLVLYPIASR